VRDPARRLSQEGIWRDPGSDELMAAAMRAGADVVGGMTHWEADHEAAPRRIAFCLEFAERRDADVDMHVDDTDDGARAASSCSSRRPKRRGWGDRTTAGHVCAMAAWPDDYAAAVIRRAAAADMHVVTNPPTNLLLQGRADAEPRRRGIPRIKKLLAAGVTVAAGQDCVDDAFYPFGTADALQVALIVAHAAQLGTPARSRRRFAWWGGRSADPAARRLWADRRRARQPRGARGRAPAGRAARAGPAPVGARGRTRRRRDGGRATSRPRRRGRRRRSLSRPPGRPHPSARRAGAARA
jgi:hypothetical protein